MTRTIDARTGGVGDLARALWIAEGARSVGETVGIVSDGYREVTEAFGHLHVEQPTKDCLGLGSGFGPYEEEMRTAAWDRSPSAVRWQRTVGWDYPLVRPIYRGGTACAEVGPLARPLVVIAPRANVGLRSLPAQKWMRLAWDLDARGVHVVAIDRANDDGLDTYPHSRWGYAWAQTLALLARASVVAGNCSGVPNLAAAIGAPTVAAMGPTDPAIIFGHCPDAVTPVRSDVPCVGCHFQHARGFRQPCDHGCEALHALRWEAVRDAILEKL